MIAMLLERARIEAGLSQEELARRAGTSRPTLSAYENGRKSPTLATAERLLAAAGYRFTLRPVLTFTAHPGPRGASIWVPDRLPELSVWDAVAEVTLPLHLDWSHPHRVVDLSDRRERARAYEVVLREGTPDDITQYVDGALLVDLWSDLVLPRAVRSAWGPLITRRGRA